MGNPSSRDTDAIEQHIERLAAILDKHDLQLLEYEADGARIKLSKGTVPSAGTGAGDLANLGAVLHSAQVIASAQLGGLASNSSGTAAQTPSMEAAGASGVGGANGVATTAVGTSGIAIAGTGEPLSESQQVIKAPLVGIAYRSKDPESAPFAAVGDKVGEGTVLCLIEAMKMFNEVKAPCSGTISGIHFDDGDLVEFGKPLFSMDCG
jgi:acetyl-CoA carboxylase biotin carboxyl carrier protein